MRFAGSLISGFFASGIHGLSRRFYGELGNAHTGFAALWNPFLDPAMDLERNLHHVRSWAPSTIDAPLPKVVLKLAALAREDHDLAGRDPCIPRNVRILGLDMDPITKNAQGSDDLCALPGVVWHHHGERKRIRNSHNCIYLLAFVHGRWHASRNVDTSGPGRIWKRCRTTRNKAASSNRQNRRGCRGPQHASSASGSHWFHGRSSESRGSS